jgi:hypothetical protein
MVKPLLVLVQFAFELLKKLPKVIDELAAVIRKSSLRKSLLLLQNRRNLSRRQLAGQTVHHKSINHLQRAGLLKRPAEKPNNLLHTQSIRRRLDSYNFGATDFDYTTGTL